MDSTKTIIAGLLLFLCSLSSNLHGQIQWGIRTGVNFTTVSASNEQQDILDVGSLSRMVIGLTADIPVISDLYIQPSLIYAGKGYTADAGSIGFGKGFVAKVSYIELPFHVLYKPEFGPGQFFIGAGPYVAFGRGGKWHTDQTVLIGDVMTDNKGDIRFQNDASYADYGTYVYGKPWDYGGSFIVGYNLFRKYSLQFNAEWGIANLEPDWGSYRTQAKKKNKALGISLGYKF